MYQILLVEDNESDIKACTESVEIMNKSRECKVDISVASSYDKAMDKLNKQAVNYTGVIIDIKLNGEDTGNEIIKEIIDKYRLPVAIMTGTPDTIIEEESPIKIYKKGENRYVDIIDDIINIADTGIFNVIGGKGIIEQTMNKIFWRNLYPNIEIWKKLQKEDYETEKILLRVAISCIQELLDDEMPQYVTQEMYIYPSIVSNIKTGTIIKNKTTDTYYVVLSPSCDLAIHGNKFKTDVVLLCEIESLESVNEKILDKISSQKKKANALKKAITNNYTEFYHWLPQNELFVGGYINFRHVLNCNTEYLEEEYDILELHISNYFVKDILRRFSAYYARQGQPDFDFEKEVQKYI